MPSICVMIKTRCNIRLEWTPYLIRNWLWKRKKQRSPKMRMKFKRRRSFCKSLLTKNGTTGLVVLMSSRRLSVLTKTRNIRKRRRIGGTLGGITHQVLWGMIANPSTINPPIIQTYRGVFFYPFILREWHIRAVERGNHTNPLTPKPKPLNDNLRRSRTDVLKNKLQSKSRTYVLM